MITVSYYENRFIPKLNIAASIMRAVDHWCILTRIWREYV